MLDFSERTYRERATVTEHEGTQKGVTGASSTQKVIPVAFSLPALR